MTIQDALDLIAGDGWFLDEYGCLCSNENHDCPLWYIYRHVDPDGDGDAEDYIEAGVRCGLSRRAAVAIAQAADNRGSARLRKRMLDACSLREGK
jgi:hypothetical protein